MKSPIEQTKQWLEKFVIAHNICPFAARVYQSDRIRFQVSQANLAKDLLRDFKSEVALLMESDASLIDTTLLIHPFCMEDFLSYWDFVGELEEYLAYEGADEFLQVASFHPQYIFAGSSPEDPSNYTNRSPYPMLHLLREESLDQAIDAYGDTEQIPERNIALLNEMGIDAVRRMTDD